MRGLIKLLNAGMAEGVIHADNGDSICFEFSAVLAYDVALLAVGRLVSFDLDGRGGSSAVNVCIHRPQPSPQGDARPAASLRYVGFEQTEGMRSYKFERTPPGENMKTVVVTTDMAIFTQHRVLLQDGPALCLRLLETESASDDRYRFALTETDLITFLEARLGAIKPLARRVWRRQRPAASKIFHTPQR
jgi:cold shock CspA family protein